MAATLSQEGRLLTSRLASGRHHDMQIVGDEYDEPVLTAAEMRAAEAAVMASGLSELVLMERAGTLAADAIAAYCGRSAVLVFAGPGNNGGDGYVTARVLRERGWPVRVSAAGTATTAAARTAAERWAGPIETPHIAQPGSIFVDAVFGTGLSRPLDPGLLDHLQRLATAAGTRIALDFPSGTSSDDGAALSPLVAADLTIAFGALKPSHLLYPAAAAAGRIVIGDIGLGELPARLVRNARPATRSIMPEAHKYERGHVLVIGGEMSGAAYLAARAAQRAGAGYVTLTGMDRPLLSSIVSGSLDRIDVARVGAVVLGPGIGRDMRAREVADKVLALRLPTVIDADMFTLYADWPSALFGRNDVMTPHEGEFLKFFGSCPGSKVERARVAAARSDNVVVLKGPDTVIAAPDGRAAINAHASPRLATAGSGDVLAGIIAAYLAQGDDPFTAACAAVWHHGDAARRGHDGLVAEDLLRLIA